MINNKNVRDDIDQKVLKKLIKEYEELDPNSIYNLIPRCPICLETINKDCDKCVIFKKPEYSEEDSIFCLSPETKSNRCKTNKEKTEFLKNLLKENQEE